MAVLTTAALMLSMLTTANAADSVSVKAGDTALSTQTSSEIDINDNLVVTFPDGTNAAEKSVEINEVVYEDVMKLSSEKNADGTIINCPVLKVLLPGSDGNIVNTPLTGEYTFEMEFNMSPVASPANSGWEMLTGFRIKLEGQNNDKCYSELRIRPDYGMALSNNRFNADRGENYIVKSNTWNKLKIVWDLTNSTGRTLNMWLNDVIIYENVAISDDINAYSNLNIGSFNMESLEKSMLINNLSFTKTENGTTTAILDTDFSDVSVNSLLNGNCQKNGDGSMTIENILYASEKAPYTAEFSEDKKTVTITPDRALGYLDTYKFTIGEGLLSVDQAQLIDPETFELTSVYDSNVYAKYTKVTENAGAYTGEARLINYTNESAAVDLITVVFDGSKMVDFNKKTVTVPANGDITDTVTVTPETDGEYTAECYVWNSIDNLMPVCPNF